MTHPTKGHSMTTKQQVLAFALILGSVALMTACKYNVPVSMHEPQVIATCERTDSKGTYNGQHFMVFQIEDMDEMYKYCGKNNAACAYVEQGIVYVRSGPNCPKDLAHEINHLVGNHWVDRPDVDIGEDR